MSYACFFVSMYIILRFLSSFFFFFNDTATTEIYTLSLHDALPISGENLRRGKHAPQRDHDMARGDAAGGGFRQRSEEHTSELQSPCNLVCRLLLEKKKKIKTKPILRKPGRVDDNKEQYDGRGRCHT